MMADVLDFNDAPAQGDKPIAIALAYAARGWPVFPCNPLTKAPLTERGFKEASTDAFKVRSWWARWPQAMVGVPTGAASGFWVLDIDQGDGKQGLQSLSEMGHDLAELMDTVVSNTASGGYHCLFRFDPAHPVTNARGALKRHLDVRGEGGYIVAAGSTRADGRRYAWLNPPDENEIADAPEWLLAAVQGGAQPSDSFDFNQADRAPKPPAERVAAIEPGTWHENTRDLVARMVREGASDETIAAIAPRFTAPGYSHDQTVREFLTHARTAREKWGYQPRDVQQEAEQTAAERPHIPILSRRELRAQKRPEWLIDEVIVEASVASLYGASGSLKSFVAIDMALSVTHGLPFHGRETKQGATVYVTGEGRDQIDLRIRAWELSRGVSNDDAPFFVIPMGIAVSDPRWVGYLIEDIKATVDAPSMIWLDTLARTFGAGDENSQKDMNAFVSGVDRLRDAFRCTVGIVHHTGKDDTRGLRGSSALYAAMDTVICTDRKAGKMQVTLKNQQPHGKQKDAGEFDDLTLEAKVIGLGFADKKGREVTSLALVQAEAQPVAELRESAEPGRPQGQNQAAILSALKRAKGQPLGRTSLVGMLGKPSISVQRSIDQLLEKGLIKASGNGWTLS